MSETPASGVRPRARLPDTRSVIAVLLVAGALVALGLLFFVQVPTANERLVDIVLGTVLGAFTTAVAFYLGSSKGSADKTALIGKGSQP